MVVAFTITRINYLVVSLFCDMVLPLSYVYWPAIYICGIKLFWLGYSSCFRHSDKSGYDFPKIIHHILVGVHQLRLEVFKKKERCHKLAFVIFKSVSVRNVSVRKV